jgi:hypothetical protein
MLLALGTFLMQVLYAEDVTRAQKLFSYYADLMFPNSTIFTTAIISRSNFNGHGTN